MIAPVQRGGVAGGQWVVPLAIAVVILLGTGLVALARDGGDDEARPPTTTTTTVRVDGVPSTTAPVLTTVPSSPTTTLSSGSGTTTTSVRRGPTTTGLAPRAPAPATTAAPRGIAACAPSLFRSTVTSDRTSYQNGETAYFTATFENISGRPCSYAGTTVTSQIIAPTGLPLTAPQVLARENVDNVPFQPGATQTFRSSWEVATCSTPSMCFPGRYTMVIDVVPFGGGRVPVAVT